MLSHNTVSFLLEMPGPKDWECLKTRMCTVLQSVYSCAHGIAFLQNTYLYIYIFLISKTRQHSLCCLYCLRNNYRKRALENDGGKKLAIYASAWNKVWNISCGGKGKRIFYRLLHTEHSHLLNTAKEITHLLSTRNYKKNCSLWTPAIESPETALDICFALC